MIYRLQVGQRVVNTHVHHSDNQLRVIIQAGDIGIVRGIFANFSWVAWQKDGRMDIHEIVDNNQVTPLLAEWSPEEFRPGLFQDLRVTMDAGYSADVASGHRVHWFDEVPTQSHWVRIEDV